MSAPSCGSSPAIERGRVGWAKRSEATRAHAACTWENDAWARLAFGAPLPTVRTSYDQTLRRLRSPVGCDGAARRLDAARHGGPGHGRHRAAQCRARRLRVGERNLRVLALPHHAVHRTLAV